MNNLYSYLDAMNARALPASAYHEIEGSDAQLISQTYSLDIAKGKKETVTITDVDIIKSVESLRNAQYAKEYIAYGECLEYSRLWAKRETLKNMGFNTVGDFAHYLFGKSTNTINEYARIGRFFITMDDEGHPVPLPCFPRGTSVSILHEMLRYAYDEDKDAIDVNRIISWYSTGLITDGMSVTKVRNALKLEYRPDEAKPGKSGKSDDSKSDDSKSGKSDDSKSNDSKSNDSKSNDNDNVSFHDQLETMSNDVAINTALNALDVVIAVFSKFDHANIEVESENPIDVLNELKAIARSFLD